MSSEALAQAPEAQRLEQTATSNEAADPLAEALLFLAAHHGRALSREALLAGLPIVDDRLSVALVSRAAQRAGLEVEPVKRPLWDIPSLVLPAVLIMRDGSIRILVRNAEDPETLK